MRAFRSALVIAGSLAFGAPLVDCNVVLGLDNLKDGPAKGLDSGPPSNDDAGANDAANSPGADGSTCGGRMCGPSQQCDNSQCCPASPGGGTCSVFPLCGCSPTQNCGRIHGTPEQCVAAGGSGVLGSCTDATNCLPGLACAGALCLDACDKTCQQANYVCTPQLHSVDGGTASLGYGACVPHCNPLSPQMVDAAHAACAANQRCDLDTNTMGATYCEAPAGSGGQGASCNLRFDCQPGYTCVHGAGGSSFCGQYCAVGSGAVCTSGTTCQGFSPALHDRTQEIGACQ